MDIRVELVRDVLGNGEVHHFIYIRGQKDWEDIYELTPDEALAVAERLKELVEGIDDGQA